MAEKTYTQYLGEVSTRFNALEEEQKDVIRSLEGTAEGAVLSQVLGQDLSSMDMYNEEIVVDEPTPKRGLAARI
jgi:hypothetical protein